MSKKKRQIKIWVLVSVLRDTLGTTGVNEDKCEASYVCVKLRFLAAMMTERQIVTEDRTIMEREDLTWRTCTHKQTFPKQSPYHVLITGCRNKTHPLLCHLCPSPFHALSLLPLALLPLLLLLLISSWEFCLYLQFLHAIYLLLFSPLTPPLPSVTTMLPLSHTCGMKPHTHTHLSAK